MIHREGFEGSTDNPVSLPPKVRGAGEKWPISVVVMGSEMKRRSHILIVEDSAEVAEAFSLLLEQEGYRVSTTTNARDALALLKRERPQLVFVDLVMPVFNGVQLIDAMKCDSELVDIPVVAVTASTHRPVGVHTVKKPFAGSQLLEAAKFYCRPMSDAPALSGGLPS
jgi:CheY-like chemotaxis protein